jgi:L-threonylcarbamoyladenylate synthase
MTDFKDDIEACLKVLHNGGIILYPTDTIWGLGCDATNAAAVQKIFDLKQPTESKSFVVLVSDERELMQYVATLDLAVFDFLDQQTKPTTVIYENVIGLADNVLAADGSVAIRICKQDFCKNLIKRFRKPIISTSANISNQPAPSIFKEIVSGVIEKVDYIVKYTQGNEIPAQPSAIVKWTDNEVVVIRE